MFDELFYIYLFNILWFYIVIIEIYFVYKIFILMLIICIINDQIKLEFIEHGTFGYVLKFKTHMYLFIQSYFAKVFHVLCKTISSVWWINTN